MELCAPLPALNVKENVYSLFHVTCPFLRRNCKYQFFFFLISGGGGGGGWGARGKEYTNLKRSTLLKDINPPFRDLDDNQIEELPPGVFDNNTELAIL